MHLAVRVAAVSTVELVAVCAVPSCGNPPTKNAVRVSLTADTSPTSSTSAATSSTTTATLEPPQTVLTQGPTAGTVLHPGAPVALTMHACPQ